MGRVAAVPLYLGERVDTGLQSLPVLTVALAGLELPKKKTSA